MTDLLTQVRAHLADIPALVAEAEHYITPGSAPADPDARHATTIFKIPIVPEVFDLLDGREKDVEEPGLNRMAGERRLGVLPTLALWVALAYAEIEDRGERPRVCCPPRRHTIVGESGWLYEYAAHILDFNDDFAADIAKLHRELQRACRVRQEYVPKCPQCRWRVEPVYSDGTTGPAYWRCTGCTKTWVHDAEVARLALTQPKMTLRQISSMLNIPLRTLYNWRNQGRFSGGPLFEVDHVRRAAERVGLTA